MSDKFGQEQVSVRGTKDLLYSQVLLTHCSLQNLREMASFKN
jgi:hypothetical protein